MEPLREARGLGRRRQRTAVDALDVPAGGQLAQVAADRVVGHAELDDNSDATTLPSLLEPGEDGLAAFGGQHPCGL